MIKLIPMVAAILLIAATSAVAFPLRCPPGYHRGIDLRCHFVGFRHDRFRRAEHPLRPERPRPPHEKPMPYGGH
jgi:hypothetical protein